MKENAIKDNLTKVVLKVMESARMIMEGATKVSGKKESFTGKEYSQCLMELHLLDVGKMIKGMENTY